MGSSAGRTPWSAGASGKGPMGPNTAVQGQQPWAGAQPYMTQQPAAPWRDTMRGSVAPAGGVPMGKGQAGGGGGKGAGGGPVMARSPWSSNVLPGLLNAQSLPGMQQQVAAQQPAAAPAPSAPQQPAAPADPTGDFWRTFNYGSFAP